MLHLYIIYEYIYYIEQLMFADPTAFFNGITTTNFFAITVAVFTVSIAIYTFITDFFTFENISSSFMMMY